MTDTTMLGVVTERELTSQPDMWAHALTLPEEEVGLLPAAGERAVIVGCGTSYYIGLAYASMRNRAGLGRTRAAVPAELDWLDDDEHIVLLSRSGTTGDVVDLARKYRDTRRVTAILGDTHTPLADLCDRVVALAFADERSVVQTRFATTALTCLRRSIGHAPVSLVDDARRALSLPLPVDPTRVKHVVFLGQGFSVGLAQEAALKLRESAGAWTEAYPVREYLHGPISCAGPDSLIWALDGLPDDIDSAVRATGATTYTNDLDPQASLVLAHRLALAMARHAHRDPDTPPYLNRSVIA